MDTIEVVKQSESGLTTRWMLVILCGLAFLYGVQYALDENPDIVDLLLVWGMDVVTILICARDARRRGRVLPHGYRWVMFFTWPLSILVYYVWARGFKGLGLVLLWWLIVMVIYIAGGMVVLLAGPVPY